MSTSVSLKLENPQNPPAHSLPQPNLAKGVYNNKHLIIILRLMVTQTTYNLPEDVVNSLSGPNANPLGQK